MAEFQQFDKLAIPYANNAPGNQCWTDTQERFYQYYADQGVWEFQGFPDEPGDPSDNAALIQNVADFLEGAENPGVFFGVQSSDCVEFLKGLAAAGVDAGIVVSTACVDDTVLGLPESEGMFVELQGYNVADPASLTDFANVRARRARGGDRRLRARGRGVDLHERLVLDGHLGLADRQPGHGRRGRPLRPGHAERGRWPAWAATTSSGRPPVDCAGAPEEYQSICYRDATYLQWNGSEYTTDTPLGTDYIDVTELMEKVAESKPAPGELTTPVDSSASPGSVRAG